ncbi:MAG: quinol:cytochrome C oxidoreductase [Myxococcales bacterium]|nr:quinol:cytochrome C oxidoreductase [Myxococcales bacterium]MCB9705316.1 quinol:cytochrome C oxidoreductase [Myxococcales bacterium]
MSSHGATEVSKDQVWLKSSSLWAKLPIIGVILAAAGLGGAFSMMGADPQHFWYSYLTALATFIAFGLGGLFFVIIQHVTRAGWSIVVRRLAENVMITLPALALCALPVVFMGSHELYEWTHLEVVQNDPMLSSKASYLNEGFFTTRMLTYFGIWTLLSVLFYGWSTSQDNATGEAIDKKSHAMRWLSAPAVLLFALSMTFFAFDALMSLDPHWFSTMFGVYYFAGIAVSAHAMLALLSVALRNSGYLKGVVTEEHNHDLGKLMFGFTVFFAYIGFSQYFLIWYANIPEETRWFAYRIADDFLPLTTLLAIGRFPLPFYFLLPRAIKRSSTTLILAAIWILFMEIVDMFWLVQPVLAHHHAKESGEHHMTMHIGAVDLLTIIGIGGVFLAVFGWALKRRALVPVKDPRLTESVTFENF